MAVLLLIIIATLFPSGSVDALKLTSLGSTFDNHKSTDGTTTEDSSETLEDVDYSSLACPSASDDNNNEEGSPATCSSSYGVDNSFPIHHSFDDIADDTKKNNPLNGEQKKLYYDEFMKGCRERYNRLTCDGSEVDRISMNLRQPKSMFVSISALSTLFACSIFSSFHSVYILIYVAFTHLHTYKYIIY